MTTGDDQHVTGGGTATRRPPRQTHADAIDAFIAAANTGDPARRARLLSLVLAPDVSFHGPLGRGAGRGAVEDFIRYLRGDPRLQAGEESDSCWAGQEQAMRRQAERRRLSDSAGARVISHI